MAGPQSLRDFLPVPFPQGRRAVGPGGSALPEPGHREAPVTGHYRMGSHSSSAGLEGVDSPPSSTSAHPSPHAKRPALRGSLGLCRDWLSVWLLVCQSLSMGQGAFKAIS